MGLPMLTFRIFPVCILELMRMNFFVMIADSIPNMCFKYQNNRDMIF